MKSFGKLYVDVITYPIFPNQLKIEKGWTNETTEPYRRGSCLVVKPPFIKKAAVVGVWGQPQDEERALTEAINARKLDVDIEELMEW